MKSGPNPKGFSTTRRCSDCAHKWWVDKWRCGKEEVSQLTAEAARMAEGDCGPRGKYFLEMMED